ncbi:hypothetical protein FE236_04095 [Mariprofundus erugo]|uniref:Uncharacterized protein n=1 Tax=Mariprofundus erugo TaxID=2528639 RepID=A0A5R9GK70_9PROT|nr:hypothetical protein [Mariprofundus erugo]TLS66976.1 hypothetical protein FEF65_08425 [Mariprofundus erugo]TLS77323.1 hypothetical protein FE236_04095 [Mariprofundus erugo]
MSSHDTTDAITTIRKKQENIAVVIGVAFTLTLCIYFFTYAMLVDKGNSVGLWLMGISSLLMLLTLIYLKQVSFFMARLWLGRKPELREAFASLRATQKS